MPTVEILEADARLSDIVALVEAGERFTITVRGQAKAEVIPVQADRQVHTPEEIEAAYQRLRNPRIEGISHETIPSWIEEGRP